MSDIILSIRNLSKSFRSHWTFRSLPAVSKLSLDVIRGEAFGFLGHNGAGKTTTMKCILGFIRTSGGEIVFEGEPLVYHEQHRFIGYLPELPYFYDHLTVSETMDLFASLHGFRGREKQRRIEHCLERVGLGERRTSGVRTLSKGLQQRLAFAQAIVNEPRLLLLDEPFSGLDPVGRREMRELLLELRSGGTTIVLSSHVLSDIEAICDRVSIMASGELKAVFAIRDIPQLFGERFELAVHSDGIGETFLTLLLRSAESSRSFDTGSGRTHTFLFSDSVDAHKALSGCLEHGIEVNSFQRLKPSLEEIFVQITGASAPHVRTSVASADNRSESPPINGKSEQVTV